MTETAHRTIEDLMSWSFPEGLVPLDVAERMDHIKALGQAFLLSLRTKSESARLTEYIVQRRDAGLGFVEIATEIHTTWGIDISNDSCRDRYKRHNRPHPKIVPEQPKTAPIETRIEDHIAEATKMVPQAGPSQEPDTKQLQSIQVNPWDPGMGDGPLPESTKEEILKRYDDHWSVKSIADSMRLDGRRVQGIVMGSRKSPHAIKSRMQRIEHVAERSPTPANVARAKAFPSSEYEALREETNRLKAEGKSLPEIACHLAATAEKGSQQVDDPEKKAAFMEQARIDTRIITLHQQARMNPAEIAEKLQLPESQVQARIDAIIGRCKK
jgi:DNA-directed RNA polymerase specialized sigma24 family protein